MIEAKVVEHKAAVKAVGNSDRIVAELTILITTIYKEFSTVDRAVLEKTLRDNVIWNGIRETVCRWEREEALINGTN